MGFYVDQLLPRFTDVALGRPMEAFRARVTAGLDGDVLEIGFGSGRNLAHLPPEVSRVLAVEPASGGRQLARKRIARADVPVEFVGVDGQDLALRDGSVDHALVTWTLCTIPDVGAALREMHRVVRPGGTMHFVEHGRSHDPAVAMKQERWNPRWRRVFGGCNLDRKIDDLIEAAGFELTDVDDYPMREGSVAGYFYEGVATRRANLS